MMDWRLVTYTNFKGFSIYEEGFGCVAERWEEKASAERLNEMLSRAALIVTAVKNHAALVAALEVISEAINDGDGGSYWPARKYLDQRGIYNGDLNDLRVLDAVAKAALAAVKE